MQWDTIVIGSGAGGMTAALALARAGQKVVVLEQHYLPGGWTHSFTLEGYRFSPGVHYLGELREGGNLRKLYEGLGVARDLEFKEMNPNGFDHFLIDGQQFDQPRGKERWIERLTAAFPHEREGIARYFSVIGHVADELKRVDKLLMFPQVLTVPWKAPHLLRWGFATLQSLIDKCIKDPTLRAVLCAQCGNHGLGPSRVSLPLHAAMAAHYDDGAFYPVGGARMIPQAFIKALRREGGQIKVRTRVEEILVEKGRVAGVRTADGERLEAPNVICNADPAMVYGKLLPAEYCRAETRKVRRTEYSASMISIFCAVEMDLPAMGIDSGNYWLYRTNDVDGAYERMSKEMPADELEVLFLAVTSLKDPTPHAPRGHHTMEMFTFVPYAPFERWAGSEHGHRDPEYQALKQRLGEQTLRSAEKIIPGIRDHVRFLEVGTPITNDFYCQTNHGAVYGTAKTPWQMGPFAFDQRGRVGGLHFCGASTLSHGVAGSSVSGLMVATRILGRKNVEDCLRPTPHHVGELHPAI
jgi:all-trans-retinol 13,14-reductase